MFCVFSVLCGVLFGICFMWVVGLFFSFDMLYSVFGSVLCGLCEMRCVCFVVVTGFIMVVCYMMRPYVWCVVRWWCGVLCMYVCVFFGVLLWFVCVRARYVFCGILHVMLCDVFCVCVYIFGVFCDVYYGMSCDKSNGLLCELIEVWWIVCHFVWYIV